MLALLILSLFLVQGPKKLEMAEDTKILPPVIVPAGTVIPISLTGRLSTKTAKDGDGVYAKTAFPITINNQIVIPEGTNVRGRVVEVKKPGMVKGKAELTLSFQTLVLPNGRTLEIYASLGNPGFAGEKKGEATIEGESSKGQDVKDTVGGAATGGIVGVIVGGRTGGAIGAGAGAVGGILNRGKDIVIDPGTILEIVLDRPLEP